MGEVWEGEDEVLQRRVAVKLVRSDRLDDPAALARFEREAQTAARLVHPGVATVYDYGTSDGGVFLVMELLEGETMAERLRRGPMAPDEAAEAIAQVAEALRAAHAVGVVHRDVKPSNVMLTRTGARLMDFGIASGLGDSMTATGLVLGTPSYLAPERVRGEGAGPEADVYALGALLYEALTGRRAFEGATPAEVAMTHLHQEPPDPAAIDPAVPTDLAALCRDALAKDPAARPTAGDFAGRLRHRGAAAPQVDATLVEVTPTAAMTAPAPAPAPERRPPPTREGSKTWMWLLGLVVLLAAALAVVLLTRDDGEPDPEPAGNEGPAPTAPPTTPPVTAAPTTAAPTTTAPPSTTTPPTTAPPTTDGGDLAAAAVTYVETLDAGDFETAWQLTTPEFQAAQDRQSWEGYWSIYDAIEIVGEPRVDEASGTVVLPLSYDGSREDYQITLVQAEDGRWLVDGPVGR